MHSVDPRSLVELSKMAAAAAVEFDRSDLLRRLASLDELLAHPGVHVSVSGEFKQGKSTLVNALASTTLCPVDDDVATAVPTFVDWGQQASAAVVDADEASTTHPIEVDEIRSAVVEQNNVSHQPAERVRISVPSPLLEDGLVLVDTPGIGGLSSSHGAATLASLPFAEANIFVSDASQEYTESEIAFVQRAVELCPRVICVMTKIDLYPQWRRLVDINVEHLRRAGIETPLVAVSSQLYVVSQAASDLELAESSGMPDLLDWLRTQVTDVARAALMTRGQKELFDIVEQLRTPFEIERSVLANPESHADIKDELMRRRADIDELRSAAARWSTTLNDGMGDLTSDAQHDLRLRTRDLIRVAEASIDELDPSKVWPEFERWLTARAADEVVANYAFMQRRASTLSDEVAEHFRAGEAAAFESRQNFNPVDVLEQLASDPGAEFDTRSLAAKSFGVVRGAQSGAYMFRSGASIFLTAVNPLGLPMLAASAGMGLLMGRKSNTDETKRELAMSRGRAKQAVRQYLDEISFMLGKDSSDIMRRLQRELRDHYSARAEELARSAAEASMKADRAAERDVAERQQRLEVVERDLVKIRELHQRIRNASQPASSRPAVSQPTS